MMSVVAYACIRCPGVTSTCEVSEYGEKLCPECGNVVRSIVRRHDGSFDVLVGEGTYDSIEAIEDYLERAYGDDA